MSTLRVSNIEAKADASSPSVNEKLKITNSNSDVLVTVNGETAGITTIGVNTTGKTFDVNIDQKVSFVGDVITSGSFGIGAGTSISSPATNALTLGTNNAERLRITGIGSVGIGGGTPETLLHARGDKPKFRIESTNTLEASLGTEEIGRIEWEGIKSSNDNVAASIRVRQDGTWSTVTPWFSPTAIEFFTQDQSGVEITDPRLTIKSSGNIGIGTADTDRVLAVYGTGNLGTQLALESPDTNAAGLSIDGDRRYEIQSTSTVYTHPSSLIFYDRDADALRMKIDENGRVSRPYQLWIAGNPTNTTGSGVFDTFDTSSFASPVGLAFSTDRITVPIAGVYLITFSTIVDNQTNRVDAAIKINGSIILETLNTPSTVNGYHYRGASISVKLAANDYIQFENDDWYAATTTNYWKTASIYLLG